MPAKQHVNCREMNSPNLLPRTCDNNNMPKNNGRSKKQSEYLRSRYLNRGESARYASRIFDKARRRRLRCTENGRIQRAVYALNSASVRADIQGEKHIPFNLAAHKFSINKIISHRNVSRSSPTLPRRKPGSGRRVGDVHIYM